MRQRYRALFLLVSVVSLLMVAMPAHAGHRNDPRTSNLVPLGESQRQVTFDSGRANTDLAFWGNLAFQGSYNGFRILDISRSIRPRLIAEVACNGNQGDVTVWGDILIRSVDRPQTTNNCGGMDTPPNVPGFEGLQIFDISNPSGTGPEDLIAAVATDCGSHTQTLVPDLANGRILIYVSAGASFLGPSPFGNNCQAVHERNVIVEVPLSNPASARVIGNMRLANANSCHDIAVFTGINRAVGACRAENNVWDISDPANPVLLYTFTAPGVTGWHSASFTWDGEVMIMGWEPGGGSQPRCQATTPEFEKSLYFFRTSDGAPLGTWVLPRPQTDQENCTIHNYNVVPVRNRYVLVHGSYQSGTSVVDFTNPARPYELAWSDPPPLVPTQLGGAWSSYWYNDRIYESDITEGLNIFQLIDPLVIGARRLPYLNPQTQEEVIPRRGG